MLINDVQAFCSLCCLYVTEAPEGMRHMPEVLESIRGVEEVAENIRHVPEMPKVVRYVLEVANVIQHVPEAVDGLQRLCRRCWRLWRDMCTVGGGCYVMCAGGRARCGGGGGGHATYVLEAVEVVFHVVEVVDDMGCALEAAEGLGRCWTGRACSVCAGGGGDDALHSGSGGGRGYGCCRCCSCWSWRRVGGVLCTYFEF